MNKLLHSIDDCSSIPIMLPELAWYEKKYLNFNSMQIEVGSSLKTLKGSTIKRDFNFDVGKKVGNKLYFHKSYAERILKKDSELFHFFLSIESKVPFEYTVIRWDTVTNDISFEECSEFDQEREPTVGKIIKFSNSGEAGLVKEYRSIFHHKWTMVDNSYTGFDVKESWEWSKKWLSTLRETADGNSKEAWEAQLHKFNLS
jgi:hypothetical protein